MILKYKSVIVNWKYVTVGLGRLYFYMANVVCVCVCVQGILRCKCAIVNWIYVTVGVSRT